LPTSKKFQLLICDGPSCGITHDSACLKEKIEAMIEADPSLADRITPLDFTCFGRCDDGPNMMVHEIQEGEDPYDEPDFGSIEGEKGFYTGMNEEKVERMVNGHLGEGEPVDDLAEDYQ
jgi:(2Fe-2S) ferredoxin